MSDRERQDPPAERDEQFDADLAAAQESWAEHQFEAQWERLSAFEAILRESPATVFRAHLDRHWSLEFVSEGGRRLGLDPDRIPSGLLPLVDPVDRRKLRTELEIRSATERLEPFRTEFRLRTPDGTQLWVDCHARLVAEDGQKPSHVEGIVWDVSARHRGDLNRHLAIQVVELLNIGADSLDLLRHIIETIRENCAVDAVSIHLRRGGPSCHVESVGFGSNAPVDPSVSGLGPQLFGTAEQRRLLDPHCDGMSSHLTPGGSFWVRGHGNCRCERGDDCCLRTATGALLADEYQTVALVPLRSSGQVIGVLQLCDRNVDALDEPSLEFLEGLGYSIGVAIDRENAERAMRASEERYRGLFETSRDGILIQDLDGRIEMANFAFQHLVGLPVEDLRERPRYTYCHAVHTAGDTTCYPGMLLRQGYADDREFVFVRPDGSRRNVLSRVWMMSDGDGHPVRQMELFRDITASRKAERERARLVTAIEQSAETVVITDRDGVIQYVNPAFERSSGYDRDEALGEHTRVLKSGKHDGQYYAQLWNTLMRGEVWKGRLVNRRKDGTLYTEDATISPVRDASGAITNFVAVKRDITELVRLEMQLLQAQKLESIGRLAAGIAHEINTPSQYVGDNVSFLQESFDQARPVLDALRDRLQGEEELMRLWDEADLDYLREEIPRAIEQSMEGLARITKIVGAMKYFSHPASEEVTLVDLHKAIESTTTVARNEWKYVAELELDFDPDLPLVPCHPNEINQAVLNLVINAAHAIQAAQGEGAEKGHIRVATRRFEDQVRIEVTDTGTGIPETARDRIFDPFFTTKEVGRGTGQGLSLTHDIVVEKHGGRIEFDTEVGVGTTFFLWLPLASDSMPGDATTPQEVFA